jgi:hypothetical protein
MIDVALAGDVVMSNAIMRQADDRFLPAAPSQLAGIVGEWLANALDVIEQSDLSTNELADPDRHGIGAVAGSANVHERLHWQYRINRDLPDPSLLASL